MPYGVLIAAAVAVGVGSLTVLPLRALPAASESAASRAFALAYNLDRAEAVALLRESIAREPENAALHRALASILWLQILFQRGAVTSDHYLGSFTRTQVELKTPPPELDAEFRVQVARAIALSEARLKAAPGSAQAHFDLGAAVGLHASHIATVEGRLLGGFRAARRAYHAHERVLEIDPARKDAGLIVGLYRYLISTLTVPLRMMAYVAGFGGGRERGIQMIEDAAAYSGESRTDAMFALVLIYNREQRYDAALRVLADLRRAYPRNRLVLLETGSTLLRAGRGAEAEALLSEGLTGVARETRPLFPGEEALWRYKRGTARAAVKRLDDARADLTAAAAPPAQAWVAGRAHVELARISMAGGDAAQARRHAEQAESLCTRGNDPACVDDARRVRRSARGR